MKAGYAVALGLSLLVGSNGLAAADDIKPTCDVPAYLLATDSVLTKVGEALKARQPLDILVLGSRSSTIMAADGTAVVTRAEYMWNHMMLVTCYGLTGSKQGREFNFTMINGDTVDALI